MCVPILRPFSITDKTFAVEQLDRNVAVMPNEAHNFKITYPHDLPVAEFGFAPAIRRWLSDAMARLHRDFDTRRLVDTVWLRQVS